MCRFSKKNVRPRHTGYYVMSNYLNLMTPKWLDGAFLLPISLYYVQKYALTKKISYVNNEPPMCNIQVVMTLNGGSTDCSVTKMLILVIEQSLKWAFIDKRFVIWFLFIPQTKGTFIQNNII